MNNLSLIAAIGLNNELGVDNHLIWSLKEDMKFFKNITTGKTIVMGRKCFESLPGILPNRKHIVLTNNKDYKIDGITVYNSIENVLNYIKNTEEEIFIIGGAKIYEQFLPYVNKMYLTHIEAKSKADVYFPLFNENSFNKEELIQGEENNIKYKICLY